MSLFSILNNDVSTATSSSTTSSQISQALQTLAAKNAIKVKAGTSDDSKTSVLITLDAKRAANAKADAGVDAATLAKSLRADLDAQYKAAGKKDSANLTAMSGRALATIALNDGNSFSRTEVAAAKLELRARDRQSALSAIGSSSLTAASLTTYTRDLLASRETMSGEEQRLRQANPNLR